jgi:hypothetical protein
MFRQSSAAWVPLGQFEGLASALEVGCARWEDLGNSMASANVRVVPYVMRQVGHADSSMTPRDLREGDETATASATSSARS